MSRRLFYWAPLYQSLKVIVRFYAPVIPPETEMNWPVIHRLFSDARSSTASAMSSTVPIRSSALVKGMRKLCTTSATGPFARPSVVNTSQPKSGKVPESITRWYWSWGNSVDCDAITASELSTARSEIVSKSRAKAITKASKRYPIWNYAYLHRDCIGQSIARSL
jgi:hypothetical protein